MPERQRKQAKPMLTSEDKQKTLREPASSSDKSSIEKLHSSIRKSWKCSKKNRFKIIQTSKGPYKSDRWIWQGVIMFCFLWLLFVAHSYDYNLDYFKCGEGERLYEGPHQVCKNPFYKQGTTWKNMPELPYGEYGQKPGLLFNSAGWVVSAIMVLALLLNHVWHNKGTRK